MSTTFHSPFLFPDSSFTSSANWWVSINRIARMVMRVNKIDYFLFISGIFKMGNHQTYEPVNYGTMNCVVFDLKNDTYRDADYFLEIDQNSWEIITKMMDVHVAKHFFVKSPYYIKCAFGGDHGEGAVDYFYDRKLQIPDMEFEMGMCYQMPGYKSKILKYVMKFGE